MNPLGRNCFWVISAYTNLLYFKSNVDIIWVTIFAHPASTTLGRMGEVSRKETYQLMIAVREGLWQKTQTQAKGCNTNIWVTIRRTVKWIVISQTVLEAILRNTILRVIIRNTGFTNN